MFARSPLKLALFATATVALTLTAGCAGRGGKAKDTAFVARDADSRGRLELLVTGARCGGCLAKIEKAAREAPGVESARFNLTTGKLAVTLAPKAGDASVVVEALEAAGYPATPFDPLPRDA